MNLEDDKDIVNVPVELWNKWMQEREDYRNECERLRLDLDKAETRISALERFIRENMK